MLTRNWWGNIRTRGLGPTPENKCQPMRWLGLWRRPMGEGVCDSVLRMKVESREFNSAIALMSSLECDRSFCSILWDIGASQACFILRQLLQHHLAYVYFIQMSLKCKRILRWCLWESGITWKIREHRSVDTRGIPQHVQNILSIFS